ncbi:MAG: hypothetical protein ABIV28_02365 [Longimicrobiales bacterium]
MIRTGTIALAWLVAGAATVRAQTETLDEGTYRVMVGGIEVGMETFTIRQNGSGADAVVIAKGRVVLEASKGGSQIQATVQLSGQGLRPAAYEVEVRGADAQGIRATVRGSRVSARIMSSAGENQREYLVSDGAVLVDEGVAHQYYFLARRAGTGSISVPIVMPRQSRQVTASVTFKGDEQVTIAGRSVAARHLTVQPQGSAAVEVWADSEGRILKVEIPSRQYVAIRTALP